MKIKPLMILLIIILIAVPMFTEKSDRGQVDLQAEFLVSSMMLQVDEAKYVKKLETILNSRIANDDYYTGGEVKEIILRIYTVGFEEIKLTSKRAVKIGVVPLLTEIDNNRNVKTKKILYQVGFYTSIFFNIFQLARDR